MSNQLKKDYNQSAKAKEGNIQGRETHSLRLSKMLFKAELRRHSEIKF
jgi:hypothetical protein